MEVLRSKYSRGKTKISKIKNSNGRVASADRKDIV